MITITKPHYLLFCEGNAGPAFGFPQDDASRWRFVLENVESGHKVEAWDYEEILHPDRISLMAVIRGLEALDQPSKVTLVTTNRYVARGLQYGLTEWRENDFCWEHFGSIQPIRNQDLWRRVDVALRFHEVTCRWMAYDSQQDRVEGDRRDVPVETLASKASDVPTKEELFSEPPRVRSRSFSAMNISATCQFTWFQWCTAPARWIWRFVLRADTMLVYAVRSMLMLDPKPETYRARR
ncbi:MAG: RNase H family protein [Planctomycetota bacterium]